jgi:hypothetical protein
MTTLKAPLACNHVPAQGWNIVYPVDLPNGGIALEKEPVIAFRLETHEIQHPRGGPSDRFDSLTPILAGGSVSEATLYVLQLGSVYFTGDERIETREQLMAWFKRQRA